MIFEDEEENYLRHYGILRKSGRYPWGSGATESQRSASFFSVIGELRAQGFSDAEIARSFSTDDHPFTTTNLRQTNSLARNQKKAADIAYATHLNKKGYSNIAIGKKMGDINESSVRSLLAPGQKEKTDILATTANMLRDEVNTKGVIDIGKGVENHIGVSKERLATAISILKAEGYPVHTVQVDQQGISGQNKTLTKVLAKPGTTYRDIVTDKGQIKYIAMITKTSDNGGRSFFGLLPPISVMLNRIGIHYREDGGAALDGVIYVRPGVEDLSLGGARYAQVRVLVDNTHYIKGMAMYKDNLPDGVDLLFNTSKSGTGNKLDALKAVTDDVDNPFGAVVKQIGDRDEKGDIVKLTSAMNLVNQEGDWNDWKNTISTQVLSKQSPALAKSQLDMTYERSKAELDGIMALTNPTVRKKLLETYASEADSSAVHMKAAALPRQMSQVLLPINSLKETEIYAPNFRDGERVALIRYPHGGTFEIPELLVNNRNTEAKTLLGRATDAVAINSKIGERLSGADFDGDSVLVIPNPITNPLLKTTPALERLKNFDPQSEYPSYEGMPKMSAKTKGTQMGLVSNLITDMTIQRANTSDLAAAVRHSMVVIDAEKHDLNYKQSAIDNGIPNLMLKYQGRKGGGSSTLISRAKSREDVRSRKPRSMARGGPFDPATGKLMYEDKGPAYVDKRTGKTVTPMQGSKKLVETDNAYTLVSKDGGTKIEAVYADHSNRMKALANTARKATVNMPPIPYSPSASKVYKTEVDSLTAKLRIAQRNSPLERQAQVLSGVTVAAKRQTSPNMDSVQLRRVKAQALEEARRRTGAGKQKIEITDKEWTAIQAGGITPTRLKNILDNANLKTVKQLATPRTRLLMTSSKTARAKAMANSGYTQREIADALGVSLTTLKEGLK